MTTQTHTRGPWKAYGTWVSAGVDGDGPLIADCDTDANADLIATSPDLLDVLERIHAGEPVCSHASHWRGLEDDWDVHTDLCQSMTAAIAKAKGE